MSDETCCDLDITDNIWVEGVVDVPAGKRGICMLDTLSRAQVIDILQRNPRAKKDLLRVTTDPELVELAQTVQLLQSTNQSDDQTKQSARQGLPYYTLFAGRPPFAQPKK